MCIRDRHKSANYHAATECLNEMIDMRMKTILFERQSELLSLIHIYVRPNHEKGKYDFRRTVADKSQIHEIKPVHASEAQVAVNSEGKTCLLYTSHECVVWLHHP